LYAITSRFMYTHLPAFFLKKKLSAHDYMKMLPVNREKFVEIIRDF
jgi:hypothetical protein